MIARFVVVFILITIGILVWRYISPNDVKKDVWLWVRRILVSSVITAGILTAVMFINNIQGI